MADFFFWTAWAAVTNRPGEDVTYTANFPFDPLAGNKPLPSALGWSITSVVLLILGTALALFFYLRLRAKDPEHAPAIPALGVPSPTPSQRATLPYFVVAILLFAVQVVLGSVTGHYAVEGNRLFGIDTGSLLLHWRAGDAGSHSSSCLLSSVRGLIGRPGRSSRRRSA